MSPRCPSGAGRLCLALSAVAVLTLRPAAAHDPDRSPPNPSGTFREIETKDLFGFTTGSDIGSEGEKEISAETTGRFGKRGGTFRAFEHKLEFEFTPTQFMQFELGLLGTSHRIRNVTDFDDRNRSAFEGLSGEVRYLLVGRGPASPFGLALSFEPTVARIDDTTGERLRRVETEFKLSADTELVPDRVFLAFNALYEPEWVRPRFEPLEREATLGLSTAVAFRVTPDVTIGTELQYRRKYEGIALSHFEGEALYAGPTLHVQLTRKAFLSAAWSTQVAGREAADRRERADAVMEAIEAGEDPLSAVPIHHHRLDLKNFERHRAKLKVGFEF
jgi:hypothetical protein